MSRRLAWLIVFIVAAAISALSIYADWQDTQPAVRHATAMQRVEQWQLVGPADRSLAYLQARKSEQLRYISQHTQRRWTSIVTLCFAPVVTWLLFAYLMTRRRRISQ